MGRDDRGFYLRRDRAGSVKEVTGMAITRRFGFLQTKLGSRDLLQVALREKGYFPK